MNHPDLIPAVGYWRVSTAREEMISPQLQQTAIADCARRRGRRIIAWIGDPDATGRNFKRRVREAIDLVRQGEAHEVIVYRFSRFGRSKRLAWATHLDQLESVGGELISATEDVDAHTAAGRFARGMLAEVAAFQSDVISEQWQETHAHRRSRGLPGQGTPRFGYQRLGRVLVDPSKSLHRTDPNDPKGERYEPDPALVETYISMYEQYVDGNGSQKIVRWLNDKRVVTTRGNNWTVHTLFSVLDSGFAAGLLRVHDPACRCKRAGRCLRLTYIPGSQPPIITPELWQRYLARRRQMRTMPPRVRHPAYPLSGLMKCGACGYGMTISNGCGIPGYAYRCTRWEQTRECDGAWARRVVVEQAVLDQLAEWADDIQAQARTVVVRARTRQAAEVDIKRLSRDLAKLDRALVRLQKDRAMDDDDSQAAEAAYQATRAELRAERAKVAARLEKAEASRAAGAADYGPVIRELIAGWETLPAPRRRDMLTTLIRHVKVHRTGHRTPARIEVTPVWAPQET